MFSEEVISKIRRIMIDRGLTQAAVANMIGTSASQFSKILNGKVQLSLDQLANLATGLSLRVIDIITYPDVYESKDPSDDDTEAIFQIRLKKNKKRQIMNLIFGKNDIEILNK